MKLLILTQKLDRNDPILGFFHRWVEEFAKHYEKVTVIALGVGEYDLPGVAVLSLGKEAGVSKAAYLLNFYKYIWTERRNYDAVFVHMNPIYVLLGGDLWRLLGKKITLWYTHKKSDLKLKMAEKIAHLILTAAPESFTLKSDKVLAVGHGVDVERFAFHKWKHDSRTLVQVGRVTPIKHCEVLIEALRILNEKDDWKAVFIGEPITDSDQTYLKQIQRLIADKRLDEKVGFVGSMNPEQISQIFSESFASINPAQTGGMDKVVLESLAAGCPAFTSNTAFKSILAEDSSAFLFSSSDAADLATKISSVSKMDQREGVVENLSKRVRSQYSVSAIVGKIASLLNV
jgi:glycosyltransferase involved in cell wall biosynthesis